MIIVIARHCGRVYNHRIWLIIMAQEPCLNSTALLRYGQKSMVKFCRVVPFLLHKIGRIFCHTFMTKIVNVSEFTQPIITIQRLFDLYLDNTSYHQLITVFSIDFKNGPESLCTVVTVLMHSLQTSPCHNMNNAEKSEDCTL